MSMKQIGTAVLNPGTDDETWGICESAEVSPEADKKEINNGEGDTVGLLYTNCGKIKFSGILPGVDLREGSSFGSFSFINRDSESWSINAGIPFKKIRDRSKKVLSLQKRFENDK